MEKFERNDHGPLTGIQEVLHKATSALGRLQDRMAPEEFEEIKNTCTDSDSARKMVRYLYRRTRQYLPNDPPRHMAVQWAWELGISDETIDAAWMDILNDARTLAKQGPADQSMPKLNK